MRINVRGRGLKMIALGGPVEGGDFYDREEVMRTLARDVPRAHHALVGPRRTGKSSVLAEFKRRGLGDFVPVIVNVTKVVPRKPEYILRELGKKTLDAVIEREGLLRRMPEFVKGKIGQLSDFVHDNLKVKISDWLTLYFDERANLTPLLKTTFSTIESYERKLVIMLDEITSIIHLRGAAPEKNGMEFMWAVGQYIPEAKNARYIISGSQPGMMELLLSRETGPFLGRFVKVEIAGLEERGAEKLIHDKVGHRISNELVAELKRWTRCWPLYLQAYCFAAAGQRGRIENIRNLDEDVLRVLDGHFLYFESLLTDDELRALLSMSKFGMGAVRKLYPKLGMSYGSLQTAFRRLELKGFVNKVEEGIYEPVDLMFQEWLTKTYGVSPF